MQSPPVTGKGELRARIAAILAAYAAFRSILKMINSLKSVSVSLAGLAAKKVELRSIIFCAREKSTQIAPNKIKKRTLPLAASSDWAVHARVIVLSRAHGKVFLVFSC